MAPPVFPYLVPNRIQIGKYKILMPTLTIKGVPPELHERLKERAERHRRSMNSELLTILEESLTSSRLSKEEAIERAQALNQEIEASFDSTLIEEGKREGTRMIVVDNDVISYFWLEAARTEAARAVRQRDADWRVPRLWRSEFRNVLYRHLTHRDLSLEDALRTAEVAEADLKDATYSVATADVLRLEESSGRSAYDCEYVAAAQHLSVWLVTGDETVAGLFPDTAVLLEDFAAGRG